VAELAPPVILGRAGVVTKEAPRAILPEVSSTAIRDAVRAGRAGQAAPLLPRGVLAYIEAKGLYRGA
jgi:nicotinic acid mononucleotide adenylyltransferase